MNHHGNNLLSWCHCVWFWCDSVSWELTGLHLLPLAVIKGESLQGSYTKSSLKFSEKLTARVHKPCYPRAGERDQLAKHMLCMQSSICMQGSIPGTQALPRKIAKHRVGSSSQESLGVAPKPKQSVPSLLCPFQHSTDLTGTIHITSSWQYSSWWMARME